MSLSNLVATAANDKYRSSLRSTWIADPADGSLLVTAIPANLPTYITVGWNTIYETLFKVTGTSGDNSSNYALTGLTVIKGYGATGNLPEGAALNCLNNEEFFNQYGVAINDVIDAVNAVPEIDTTTTLGTSDIKVPSQNAVKTYVDANFTGWTADTDTWVYASASTFTIAGKDVTAKFTKGTRLKFTQTTVKYAVVVSSAFSTNTTVTIAVNTDYTIANAAISANYYSYQANPQGYPDWFNYTTTWTGFSGNPTYASSPRFCIIGKTCFTRGVASANGTSNSANMYMTLPAATGQSTSLQNAGRAVDNGSILAASAMVNLTADSTEAIWATQTGAGFTASGAKSVNWNFEYEI